LGRGVGGGALVGGCFVFLFLSSGGWVGGDVADSRVGGATVAVAVGNTIRGRGVRVGVGVALGVAAVVAVAVGDGVSLAVAVGRGVSVGRGVRVGIRVRVGIAVLVGLATTAPSA
jgi:hypothetical protein